MTEQTQAIATQQQPQIREVSLFELRQREAKALASSTMVPEDRKSVV